MHHLQRAAVAFDSCGSIVQKFAFQPTRGFQNSFHLQCQKAQKAADPVKGIPYKDLTIGIPKEIFKNEKRVALHPAATATLVKKGFNINVEESAGVESKFSNKDYEAAGASVKPKEQVFKSDIVLKVRGPEASEINLLKGNNLISFLYPAQNKDLIDQLAKNNMTLFAMDCVPRISRAQVFDALSSMANIAGYKAVIESANNFGRFFAGRFI